MKRGSIVNLIIGLLWVGLGIFALIENMHLRLFGVIPIPNYLVVIIGVVWTVLGIVALVRPQPAPVAPAAGQYPVTPPPQQYSPTIPQYAPRDPQGPTPI